MAYAPSREPVIHPYMRELYRLAAENKLNSSATAMHRVTIQECLPKHEWYIRETPQDSSPGIRIPVTRNSSLEDIEWLTSLFLTETALGDVLLGTINDDNPRAKMERVKAINVLTAVFAKQPPYSFCTYLLNELGSAFIKNLDARSGSDEDIKTYLHGRAGIIQTALAGFDQLLASGPPTGERPTPIDTGIVPTPPPEVRTAPAALGGRVVSPTGLAPGASSGVAGTQAEKPSEPGNG